MTTEKELRLFCNELRRIVWKCQNCGAEHSLDLFDDKQVNELYDPETTQMTKRLFCGICRKTCDSALSSAIWNLLEFHRHAKNTINEISFRIPTKEEKV